MFKRIDAAPDELSTIEITFDGDRVAAYCGQTVASALLAAGILASRASSVSAQPRAPFCLMGSCFECLVRLDGQSVQSCQTIATDGMRIERMVESVDKSF